MELENAVVVAPVVVPPVVLEAVDHDDVELNAAREALKAAETAPVVPVVTEPAATVAPAPEHAKGNPTAAIIAIRKQLQQAHAQNLLLQGQVQAFSQMAQTAQSPSPELPVVEVDPLQALHADRVALAEAFDAGDLTAKDWELKRQALDAQEWELRMSGLQAQQVQSAPVADLHLEQATAKLETDYPVLQVLTAEHLEPLAQIARHQAQAQGAPIQPGALGTLDLRTRIAKLAQQMYGGATPPAQTSTPTLSLDAQARADKLALAATMPPNVASMGSVASAVPLSESDLSARMVGMTEDEQLALLQSMPGLRQKIMGE